MSKRKTDSDEESNESSTDSVISSDEKDIDWKPYKSKRKTTKPKKRVFRSQELIAIKSETNDNNNFEDNQEFNVCNNVLLGQKFEKSDRKVIQNEIISGFDAKKELIESQIQTFETEIYFCIFCDSIMSSAQELRDHLIIHFNDCDENQCQKTITKSEMDFIETLLKYETEINNCFKLKPKQLPENNVSNLLIGCPVCDRIIKCFDLIEKRNEDQIQCFCGQISDYMQVFECIECQKSFHILCVDENNSGLNYFYQLIDNFFAIF
jgi:hypothetical protein